MDLRGSERFKPQSPRAAEAGYDVTACWTGYGRVAVLDCGLEINVLEATYSDGRWSGGGREKKREERRAVAVGERRLEDILDAAIDS